MELVAVAFHALEVRYATICRIWWRACADDSAIDMTAVEGNCTGDLGDIAGPSRSIEKNAPSRMLIGYFLLLAARTEFLELQTV